jgi:hypothetical protein
MNTSGFWWWSCRVVDSQDVVMGSGGSSQALHKSFWVAELIHTIILNNFIVCTCLYISVLFCSIFWASAFDCLCLACVPVPLRICGVVAPCCTSAVQHFDLHGEAKRAVSATAEVHTGIVGRVTWAVCLFIWSSLIYRLRSSNCCFNRFKLRNGQSKPSKLFVFKTKVTFGHFCIFFMSNFNFFGVQLEVWTWRDLLMAWCWQFL